MKIDDIFSDGYILETEEIIGDIDLAPLKPWIPEPFKRYEFKEGSRYELEAVGGKGNRFKCEYTFLRTAPGFGQRRHHLFRHDGGYIISFTDAQIEDYDVEEVEES